MDSGDLTTAQAEKIRDALIPHVRYLFKLRRRMQAQGFPLTDELFQATDRANDAAQDDLAMALHYLSCRSGVGRSRNDPSTKERR